MEIMYLWNFKPGETRRFPEDLIRHNARFVESHVVATPSDIEDCLGDPTFPSLSGLYARIPHWVIRSDLARLLMVYRKGGIYADADCYFVREFLSGDILLFTEKIIRSTDELGPRECKHPDNVLRIANFCFGSRVPRHPFFREVIHECLRRLEVVEDVASPDQADILWVCGPDVITTVYHKRKHDFPEIVLHDTSYLDHQCHGSWR